MGTWTHLRPVPAFSPLRHGLITGTTAVIAPRKLLEQTREQTRKSVLSVLGPTSGLLGSLTSSNEIYPSEAHGQAR